MAELIVNGSGSSGNSYILKCRGESLLIECGMRFSQIAGPLGYDLSSVVGCCYTHDHHDHHNKATAASLRGYGISVVGGDKLTHKQRFYLGDFEIMPLKVNHGDCPNMAFVIDCADGRLVFATDLTDFPYTVKHCNFLCIEANYSQDLRTQAKEAGAKVWSQSENHMELSTTLNVIERHVSDDLTHVVLLHLSDGLSDSDAFVKAVGGVCESKDHPFVKVYAAKAAGAAKTPQVIDLNDIPF